MATGLVQRVSGATISQTVGPPAWLVPQAPSAESQIYVCLIHALIPALLPQYIGLGSAECFLRQLTHMVKHRAGESQAGILIFENKATLLRFVIFGEQPLFALTELVSRCGSF